MATGIRRFFSTKAAVFSSVFFVLILLINSGCTSKEKNAKELFDQGVKYAQEENFEEASGAFLKYIEIEPKEIKGYISLARALQESGREDDYYSTLLKAQKAVPESPLPDIELGRFYMSKGQYEKAKSELAAAEKKDPKNPIPLTLKGLIFTREGNSKEAYDIFKHITTLDAADTEDYKESLNLAYTFLLEIIGLEVRTSEEAFKIITDAIKEMPDYGRGYSVLGIYYYKKGEIDNAIKRFDIALQKDAEREGFVNKLLGKIYEKKGDVEKSLAHYDKFIEVYGKDGRDVISNEDFADIQVFTGIDPEAADIKSVREKIKDLRGGSDR